MSEPKELTGAKISPPRGEDHSSDTPVVSWQVRESQAGGQGSRGQAGRGGAVAHGRAPLPQATGAVVAAVARALADDAQRSREFHRDQQADRRAEANLALARQRIDNEQPESGGKSDEQPASEAAGDSTNEGGTPESAERAGQPVSPGGEAGGAAPGAEAAAPGQGGQAGPQKMYPIPGEYMGKVAMPRGALKDAEAARERWNMQKEYGDFMKEMGKREWERVQRDYNRFNASKPYSPGGSQAIAPTPPLAAGAGHPAGAEKPAASEGQTPQDAAAQAAQEAERQQQLQREIVQDRRLLERGRNFRGEGISPAHMRRISEHGRGLARRLAAAGRHSDAPYIFVLVLSIINDVVDIFDVSLFFPLDQIFDLFMLMLMLGARLFVREELGRETSGWFEWAGTKIVTVLAEMTPLVGVLPCWTISAAWVWRRAVVRRRRAQILAAEEAAAEQAGMQGLADEEAAQGETYPQEEAGVA